MKNLIMIFVAFAFTLFSCSKDDPKNIGLIGSWKDKTKDFPKFQFLENSELIYKTSQNHVRMAKYRTSGSNLFITDGEIYKFTYSVSNTSLKLSRNDELLSDTYAGNYDLVKD